MTTKISTTNIQDSALTTLLGPKISAIVYPGTETATDTAGGETINLTGTGFSSGCNVLVNGQSAGTVTFISSTQISFTAPAASAGTYVIYVINPDGGTAISIPGISYSGTPTWSTTAGSVGSVYETASFNSTLTATGDAPITYTLFSGSLPTGASLNSSTGLISGTSSSTASTTTYNFTITAKDAQNQTTNRAFSLTVNPDVVTWVSPTNNTTYSNFTNTAISNVTLNATSAAGGTITYTANSLPTGISLSGSTISGTPTVVANSSTLLTATSTTTRSATSTINWVITVGMDTYFKYTTLLLSSDINNQTPPFNSDYSTNNFFLLPYGDVNSNILNPYQGSYYSNYFDGSSSYISVAYNSSQNLSNNNFTIEMYIYFTSTASGQQPVYAYNNPGTNRNWGFYVSATSTLSYYLSSNGTAWDLANALSVGTFTANTWTHVALVRNGSTVTPYMNGVAGTTSNVSTTAIYNGTSGTYIGGLTSFFFTGYISNFRMVNGTAVYTTAFTPPTTPLTAITNTSVLTCQSNRFLDNSTNNASVTIAGGSPQVSSYIPFSPGSSYSTYGSGYFDGNGDYLSIATSSNLDFSTGDFTVEAWVYPNALSSDCFIISASGTGGFFLGFSSSSTIGYGWGRNATAWDYRVASTATLKVWQHVAVTRSGTSMKLFVNGVQQGTTQTISTSYNLGTTSTTIGSQGANYYWNGYISDLRVVKGAAIYTAGFTPPTTLLTSDANTQLLTLQYNSSYNSYNIYDLTRKNTVTRNGNTNVGTFSPYGTGWSNYFNGTSDYVGFAANTALDFGTGDFTIECWVYSIKNTNNYPTFLSSVTGWSAGASGHRFSNFNSLNKFSNYLNGAGGVASGDPFMRSTNTFNFNTWYHYALTRSGNTWRMFINGALEDTQTYTGSYNCGLGGLRVGWSTWDTANGYYSGNVSNLRITKGTALYTSAFTPGTTPLTPSANTSLLTCQSNRFVDNSFYNFTATPSGTPSAQVFSPFGSISEATPITYSNYFDGSSDYFSIADNTAFNFGTGDATVEFWFNSPGTSNNYPGIISSVVYNNAGSASIRFDNTGYKNKVFMYINTGGDPIIASTTTISYNTWAHVAIVRQGTSLKLYLNGSLDTTATISASLGWYLSNGGMRIGRGFDVDAANAYFPGYVTNIRLVKGTAVYTSNFTPSTTPLTAIANTSLLSCQSSTVKDNSTNNFTLTQNGSPKFYKYNPFGYTAQTNVNYTPSLHGSSMYFDGTGDYITVNDPLDLVTYDFTVEFWIYCSVQYSKSSGCSLVSAEYSGSGLTWGISFNGYKSTNGLAFSYGQYGSYVTLRYVDSYFGIPNTWAHIVWQRRNGVVECYINGVSQTLTTYNEGTTWSDSTNFTTSATTRTIGSNYAGNYFTGYMSDFKIVVGSTIYNGNFASRTTPNTNISNAKLLLSGNTTGVIDMTRTNNLETVSNSIVTKSKYPYSSAGLSYYFNGSSSYLSIASNSTFTMGTGDFTIEAWIYQVAVGTSTYIYPVIFACGSGDGDAAGRFSLYSNHPAGSNMMYYYNAGMTNISGGTNPTTGAWNHIALTRSSGTMKYFINGTQQWTGSIAVAMGNSTDAFTIGTRTGNTGQCMLYGYVSDFRITRGYARYTSNFTSPTSSFILR